MPFWDSSVRAGALAVVTAWEDIEYLRDIDICRVQMNIRLETSQPLEVLPLGNHWPDTSHIYGGPWGVTFCDVKFSLLVKRLATDSLDDLVNSYITTFGYIGFIS